MQRRTPPSPIAKLILKAAANAINPEAVNFLQIAEQSFTHSVDHTQELQGNLYLIKADHKKMFASAIFCLNKAFELERSNETASKAFTAILRVAGGQRECLALIQLLPVEDQVEILSDCKNQDTFLGQYMSKSETFTPFWQDSIETVINNQLDLLKTKKENNEEKTPSKHQDKGEKSSLLTKPGKQ